MGDLDGGMMGLAG
jgi:hypothetical protein